MTNPLRQKKKSTAKVAWGVSDERPTGMKACSATTDNAATPRSPSRVARCRCSAMLPVASG